MVTQLPVEYHQIDSLEVFDIYNNPLVFPPSYVCMKGLLHVLKFLSIQASQRQNKLTVKTRHKRPSALLANHMGKTSISCDNFEQCYVSSHVMESGYSTADSSERLRLPSSEEPTVQIADEKDADKLQLTLLSDGTDSTESEQTENNLKHSNSSPTDVHLDEEVETSCDSDSITACETTLDPSALSDEFSEVQSVHITCARDSDGSNVIDRAPPDVNYHVIMSLRKLIEMNLRVKLPDDLSSSLRDGVILCQLANRIRPHSAASVLVPSDDAALSLSDCKKNLNQFLKACHFIGLDKSDLCSHEDIADGLQNPERLLNTVQKLLSYPPVTVTDRVVSVFCLIIFCVTGLLLVIFPLPS